MIESDLRFLEIGVEGLFCKGFPQQTDAFSTATRHYSRFGRPPLSPAALWKISQRLRRKEYDLIILHPPQYASWHPRSFLNMVKYWPLSYPLGLFANFAFNFMRCVRHTPMVAVDTLDSFGIGRHNFFCFDRCQAYYKRELPADNWRVFFSSGHRNFPAGTFRRKRRYLRYVDKLRPIGLGVCEFPLELQQKLARVPKTTDVFYAGTPNSTVRQKGLEQLLALRDQGVRVDIPETRLSRDEFLERCAGAWLVWSPEGFGWECFRHYESALAGTVPVINYPTIERYQPLEDGVHCFLYPIEGDGLQKTIRHALKDKPRLMQMAQAAREKATQYHTYRGICRSILADVFPPRAERAIAAAA